jgi:hypothetical protein
MAAGLSVLGTALATSSARADLYGESAVADSATGVTSLQTITINSSAPSGGVLGGENGDTFYAEYQTALSTSAAGTGATTYTSYCVDLAHTIPGAFTQLDNNPFGGAPAGPLPLTNTFSSGTDNGQNALTAFGQAAYIANNALTTLGVSSLTDIQRAGVQIAIWTTEYGTGSNFTFNGTTLTSGVMTFSGNVAAETVAATLLTNLYTNSGSASAYWVDYVSVDGAHAQHQLITADTVVIQSVPEPTTFAIAGLGALAFLGYGWKRRNRS